MPACPAPGGPQSLLRGIERAQHHGPPPRTQRPQSLLRGIERRSRVGDRGRGGLASIAPQRHRKFVPPVPPRRGTKASIAPQRHRKQAASANARTAGESLNRSSEASKAEGLHARPGRPGPASIAPQRHRKHNPESCGAFYFGGLNRSSEASKDGLVKELLVGQAGLNRSSEASKGPSGHAAAGARTASIAPQRHRKMREAPRRRPRRRASIAPQRHRKMTSPPTP